jgi:hypothetical protein
MMMMRVYLFIYIFIPSFVRYSFAGFMCVLSDAPRAHQGKSQRPQTSPESSDT